MNKSFKHYPPDDLIHMALSDKISFEEILRKYSLTEKKVKVIMKSHLKPSSYINWRERVKKKQYKHRKKYSFLKNDLWDSKQNTY